MVQFDGMNFSINDITYEVDLNDNRKLAVITPVLKITADAEGTLTANLKVDGHELLPSVRIILAEGKNLIRMHSVRIFNPRLKSPDADGAGQYLMTLEFSVKSGKFHALEKIIEINRPKINT